MTVNLRSVSVRLALVAGLLGVAAPVRAGETYAHDVQGRLTDVAYNDGSSIDYTYDANGNLLSILSSGSASAVDPKTPATFEFAVGPATPNPGAGDRHIAFSIATAGHVSLRVTDVAGRSVATLLDRTLTPGRFNIVFSSARWPGGVYFYRLESAGRSRAGRLIVKR